MQKSKKVKRSFFFTIFLFFNNRVADAILLTAKLPSSHTLSIYLETTQPSSSYSHSHSPSFFLLPVTMAEEDFNNLPEGCIATILSLTSPKDACRLSLVSSTFQSAAESDAVWHKFLPSDFHTLLSQSPSSSFPSKKHLYIHLCHNPLLIDHGKKVSFLSFISLSELHDRFLTFFLSWIFSFLIL